MQDDGRLASIFPARQWATSTEAKDAGPDFLATRRGGGKIVLVQVHEVAITTATVRYETYGKGVQKEKV